MPIRPYLVLVLSLAVTVATAVLLADTRRQTAAVGILGLIVSGVLFALTRWEAQIADRLRGSETALRESEERTRQALARLRVLFEGNPLPMWLYDVETLGESIVQQGRLEAGMPYLQKPFTPEVLAAKVREVLDAPVTA